MFLLQHRQLWCRVKCQRRRGRGIWETTVASPGYQDPGLSPTALLADSTNLSPQPKYLDVSERDAHDGTVASRR